MAQHNLTGKGGTMQCDPQLGVTRCDNAWRRMAVQRCLVHGVRDVRSRRKGEGSAGVGI